MDGIWLVHEGGYVEYYVPPYRAFIFGLVTGCILTTILVVTSAIQEIEVQKETSARICAPANLVGMKNARNINYAN